MTGESFERICDLQRRIQGALARAVGAADYESYMAGVREMYRSRSISFVTAMHEEARRIYPTAESDTIPLDRFDDVLALIDTQAKSELVLADLPQEFAPQAEEFLRFVLHILLPDARNIALEVGKRLPIRPGGGRPSVIPPQPECREICKQIRALIEDDGLKTVIAQKRIADKTGLSLRTIQRIWQGRKQYLASPPNSTE
jgi:hypothetical protein